LAAVRKASSLIVGDPIAWFGMALLLGYY